MTDKNWEVMNKLEESFSNINSINFMLEELKEAIDNDRIDSARDIVQGLTSFTPVYIDNWDRKFKEAWDVVVRNEGI